MFTKISEKYKHDDTGIEFKIWFERIRVNGEWNPIIKKCIRVDSKAGKGKFIFNLSSPQTLMTIGKVITEIGEFCQKL